MRRRWNYSSYKGTFKKKSTGYVVIRLAVIFACIGFGVFCIFRFLVPFISDILEGRDPSERYEEEAEYFSDSIPLSNETAGGEATVSDSYIYEIISSNSIKNDPYYDGTEIIYSTDNDFGNGVDLGTVVLYDTVTGESSYLPNVTKKYDNIMMTQKSGNYAVWVDAMKDGGGRICAYDIAKEEMFVVKEYGYAIPEVRVFGHYMVFMQVAGENTQRLYLYDLESRANVTVKIYESEGVSCGNADISGTDIVWSEYASDGRAVLRRLDISSGTAVSADYALGDWVFEPRTNGEYLLFTTNKNSLDADLMISWRGETAVKIASNVLDYAIGDDYAVYTKDDTVYVVALDRVYHSEAISGSMIRARFASLNGNKLCFYDVTDGFGLIDSVRYVDIAKGGE